jgi:hypothetical protein
MLNIMITAKCQATMEQGRALILPRAAMTPASMPAKQRMAAGM